MKSLIIWTAALVSLLAPAVAQASGVVFDARKHDPVYIEGTLKKGVTVKVDEETSKAFYSWSSSSWAVLTIKNGRIVSVKTKKSAGCSDAISD